MPINVNTTTLGSAPAGCVGWPAVTTDTQGHRTGYCLYDSQGRVSGYCNGEGGCWNVGDCQLIGTWVGESYTNASHGQPTYANYQVFTTGLVKTVAPVILPVLGAAVIWAAALWGTWKVFRMLLFEASNFDSFADSKVGGWLLDRFGHGNV